jgi:dTDP-glucose 4,6-dehydratase
VDLVFNLASPASPADYLKMPLETLRVGAAGCENLLDLARRHGAAFVTASTSEVYGDPLVHPQVESYWGNVNPIGPRSVYDESKRYAEALTAACSRVFGQRTGIARIFNTYGPRLRPSDGRVVSNFICQALRGRPVTVYGAGGQTRSLCYVSDLVTGLARLAEKTRRLEPGGEPRPVNLGNPEEITILDLARKIIALCRSASPIVHRPLPADDPVRRCPDIGRARRELGWQPEVSTAEGLEKTVAWFRENLPAGD